MWDKCKKFVNELALKDTSALLPDFLFSTIFYPFFSRNFVLRCTVLTEYINKNYFFAVLSLLATHPFPDFLGSKTPKKLCTLVTYEKSQKLSEGAFETLFQNKRIKNERN